MKVFGLLNYSIAPHYKSNHFETKLVDKMVEYYKKNHIKFKTLCDGEVIIVNL